MHFLAVDCHVYHQHTEHTAKTDLAVDVHTTNLMESPLLIGVLINIVDWRWGSPYCCVRGLQISRLPYGAPMSGDVMVVQMRYIVQHESGFDFTINNHNITFHNLAKCRVLSAVLVLGAFVWMWWSNTICTEADLISGWSYDERVNDHNMPLLGNQCRTGYWVWYLMVLASGTCATEDSVWPVLYSSLTCCTHCAGFDCLQNVKHASDSNMHTGRRKCAMLLCSCLLCPDLKFVHTSLVSLASGFAWWSERGRGKTFSHEHDVVGKDFCHFRVATMRSLAPLQC